MTYSAAALAWAAREADRPYATAAHRAALAALDGIAAAHGADLIDPFTPDREIRRQADLRAGLLRREVDAWPAATDAAALVAWVCERVESLGARGFDWPGKSRGDPAPAGSLGPMLARAQCPMWWRRQLRRAVVRNRETLAMIRGEVSARRQTYCTDDTLARRAERNAANRAMLEATEIENEAGDVITLAQAAEASTANKAIRRGELMTRIKGCEEWSDAAGMVGIFTTNTAPSRFHPQTMAGGANPKHDGSDPKAAQRWLCKTWARCRAKLARLGVQWYGFRVAEPHHDGCPHWHMMLWTTAAQVDTLKDTIRAAWLADDGDEPGAAAHRFKAKTLTPGGAAAYCAKYIAKNIDDAGAVGREGHQDTDEQGQSDWVGLGKAARVEAWAAAWGIRQFQALGQPPVTVWRELRRIDGQAVTGAHPGIRAAHEAVQREGIRRASWRAYMAAQGGPMTGRGYAIRIARSEAEPRTGRYGDDMPARPVGVEHVERPGEWCLSNRREWKPRGTWAHAAAVVEVTPPQPGAFVIGAGGAFMPNPEHARWQAGQSWIDARGIEHAPRVNSQVQRPVKPPSADGGRALAVHPWSRVNNCTQARPRAGFSAAQLEAFRRAHGPLRVALADRSPDPGQW